MNKEEAIKIVEPFLKRERFEHTLRVADTAVELATIYNESIEKVEMAAIFHDYAKYFPLEDMKKVILKNDLPKDLFEYHSELWHGPVASVLVEQEYGIEDHEIHSAIRYHTTGRANMSMMDKIIFVADYIEPGRNFPGVEEVREMAKQDLTRSAWMALANTIRFLVSRHATVYPDTFYAYNDLTKRINGGS
ncbi:bis(5'-nucleosyl)-tetraphosphatase (symmetrical) YqeK [Virgibacillus kekensis]|uniref:bis(5'-nucleosyl)-tetraphosphatase (symmetrical) n=1 Tax=Virgibacillus kekensis TaxID=202261 RepID=A0ABV9DJE9_9BACI